MNTRKAKSWMVFMLIFVFLGALLIAGCGSRARVGALQTESQSVDLGDAKSVRVEIDFGAGDLEVTGGAEKLLEADFTYNVAKLKPEVEYTDGTLIVRQPEVKGLPILREINDYRNQWDLRLYEQVPMDLSVDVGAGTTDLQLAGLSLTRLNVTVGAGESTIDLSGDWARDLDATIDAGAGNIRLQLPSDVGARVEVDTGIGTIKALNLTKDGNVYTNAAYGASDVTVQVTIEAGVGQISLEVEEAVAEQPEAEGAAYEDPQGRFTMPLVGDWTQLETDGSYELFEIPGIDFKMYALSVESGELVAGQAAALNQVGIDPAALTKKKDTKLGDWYVTFYTQGEGQGVTPLCQVVDQVTYCLIATGDASLTYNPPENVIATIQGFSIAGKEVALPSTVEEFEAYVNSFVGQNPPGLSIVISRGGQVLYQKDFGMADGPSNMPAGPDTVYMWGSMTKIVTGVAIMQLVDQGLVDLDAPVSDYLEYFPAEYGITVRQLVNHSSGLGDSIKFIRENINLDGQPLPDPDQAAKTFLEGLSELKFEPGSASAYGNPGYVILGQIVAEASGQPYIEYVRDHILAPLGMANTDFTYSNPGMIAHAAAPALPADKVEEFINDLDQDRGLGDGADFIREVGNQFAWMNRYNVMAANGGLLGPATEVLRFAQMHLNGGELDGVRILSSEAVALMQEMQFSTTGNPLGYGVSWLVHDEAGHPYVEHDGGGTGLWAKMRLYPEEGLAIVLMSNASGWDRDKLADAAANVVFSMVGK